MNKRSLASKCLHFHKPDIFFIYDRRAREAINSVTPSMKKIDKIAIDSNKYDDDYLKFCRRCQWLVDYVREKHNRKLSPCDVDKILLGIIEEKRKRT